MSRGKPGSFSCFAVATSGLFRIAGHHYCRIAGCLIDTHCGVRQSIFEGALASGHTPVD